MWRRCYDPTSESYNDYKNVLICNEFKLFSNYLKWIQAQPRFEEFCSTCNNILWSIDKDNGGGHYFPHMVVLTTQSENTKLRNTLHGNPWKLNVRPIIGINKDTNSIILLKYRNEAKEKGFNPNNITLVCQGKRPHHMGYKWYYLNIKHEKRLRKVVHE